MIKFRSLRAAVDAVNNFYGFESYARLRTSDVYCRRLFNEKYFILERETGFDIWKLVDMSGKVAIVARGLTIKQVFALLPEPIKVELTRPRFIRKAAYA